MINDYDLLSSLNKAPSPWQYDNKRVTTKTNLNLYYNVNRSRMFSCVLILDNAVLAKWFKIRTSLKFLIINAYINHTVQKKIVMFKFPIWQVPFMKLLWTTNVQSNTGQSLKNYNMQCMERVLNLSGYSIEHLCKYEFVYTLHFIVMYILI